MRSSTYFLCGGNVILGYSIKNECCHTGSTHPFVLRGISDEVENGRPHPDMIFKLMEQLEISDAQAVAKVGNPPVDLQEGTSAGCKIVIGVLGDVYEKADLENFEHTALLSSVRNVPQFIHNYAEELVA